MPQKCCHILQEHKKENGFLVSYCRCCGEELCRSKIGGRASNITTNFGYGCIAEPKPLFGWGQ